MSFVTNRDAGFGPSRAELTTLTDFVRKVTSNSFFFFVFFPPIIVWSTADGIACLLGTGVLSGLRRCGRHVILDVCLAVLIPKEATLETSRRQDQRGAFNVVYETEPGHSVVMGD